MFTGIVTDIGEVVSREDGDGVSRFAIACAYPADSIALGASIACCGPCLTATSIRTDGNRTVFTVDVSGETLDRTTAGAWKPGTRINLERSLRQGDELGGHVVTGHIDGVATIVARDEEGEAVRFTFDVPAPLHRFIAEKGSVCLDGTSLTVNGVAENRFWVTLIPHTLQVTTWGDRQAGDPVNIEVDLMARYVARLKETEHT
ncbi:riboflavin synthase [Microbaculum marinum]|uniref:Riboflavin synthase n=1 Tax=Microbaculum marinum TaxID=1764581 RepID=A0AAW9S0M9_9HYPH